MSVVEIALTAEQLASAYLQLSEQERRCFLEAVLSHPAHQHIALELLIAAQAVLKQKFSPDQQRLLDAMDMTFWLPQAEAALAQVAGSRCVVLE